MILTNNAAAREDSAPSSHLAPNVPTTGCSSDIPIEDASDISIGDLHPNAAEYELCKYATDLPSKINVITP